MPNACAMSKFPDGKSSCTDTRHRKRFPHTNAAACPTPDHPVTTQPSEQEENSLGSPPSEKTTPPTNAPPNQKSGCTQIGDDARRREYLTRRRTTPVYSVVDER